MRLLKTPASKVDSLPSLRFSPDGHSIYLIADATHTTRDNTDTLPTHAYRIDVASGEITGNWSFKPSEIATFSPDLRSLYFKPYRPHTDSDDCEYLHLLDLDTGSVREVFHCANDDYTWDLTEYAMSPDGRVLAFAEFRRSGAERIYRLGLGAMQLLEPIETTTIWLRYSHDSRWLATYGFGHGVGAGVQVWEGTVCVGEWQEPGTSVAWAPDGRLAWGTAERLVVARPGEKVPDRICHGTGDVLLALSFSPDGRLLVGGTSAGVFALDDSLDPARRKAFDWGVGPIHSVAFSPDGLTCAAGGEKGQVVVWDVDS